MSLVCAFCSTEMQMYDVRLVVLNDGTRHTFCGSKCMKNFKKKRKLKYAVKQIKSE